MRPFLIMLLVLVGSGLAGSMVGLAAAEWVNGDQSYVLVFMAVPVVALVSLAFFLIAGTRPDPARAVNNATKFLLVVLALMLFGLSALELGASGSLASAWRGIQFMLVLAGSGAVTVLFQWVVFRLRARKPVASPPPRFGRQPEMHDA